MTLNAFAGGLTCKQIVTLAERKANNPGLHLTSNGVEPGTTSYVANPILDAPAYACLQIILDELALVKTFTFTRTALNFSVVSLHNDLPASFWRVAFSDPVWLSTAADAATTRERFYLLDSQEFHARQDDGVVGRPRFGYINRQLGVLTVNPEPDQAYIAELHYYPYQVAIADIDDYPWFPYSTWLVNKVLCDLYVTQDDTRYQIADKENKEIMKRISNSMGDERDRASAQLELDSRVYSRPFEI